MTVSENTIKLLIKPTTYVHVYLDSEHFNQYLTIAAQIHANLVVLMVALFAGRMLNLSSIRLLKRAHADVSKTIF